MCNHADYCRNSDSILRLAPQIAEIYILSNYGVTDNSINGCIRLDNIKCDDTVT
jgi:hypothetical protein